MKHQEEVDTPKARDERTGQAEDLLTVVGFHGASRAAAVREADEGD